MSSFATRSFYSERLEICRGCERFFKPTNQCKECGCFMKIKARIPGVACPLGFWEPA